MLEANLLKYKEKSMKIKLNILIVTIILTIIVFCISTYMQKKLINYVEKAVNFVAKAIFYKKLRQKS